MGAIHLSVLNLHITVNMAYMSKDEEALISFLRGVNQAFLAYLFLTIGWSIALEDHGRDLDVVPEDYDFDLESGLMKGARHTTSVVSMAVLCAASAMWVILARLARTRRCVDLQNFGLAGFEARRHC